MIRYSDFSDIDSLGQRFINLLANYFLSGDIVDADLVITSNSGVTLNIYLGTLKRLEVYNNYIIIGSIPNSNFLINLEDVLTISITEDC